MKIDTQVVVAEGSSVNIKVSISMMPDQDVTITADYSGSGITYGSSTVVFTQADYSDKYFTVTGGDSGTGQSLEVTAGYTLSTSGTAYSSYYA